MKNRIFSVSKCLMLPKVPTGQSTSFHFAKWRLQQFVVFQFVGEKVSDYITHRKQSTEVVPSLTSYRWRTESSVSKCLMLPKVPTGQSTSFHFAKWRLQQFVVFQFVGEKVSDYITHRKQSTEVVPSLTSYRWRTESSLSVNALCYLKYCNLPFSVWITSRLIGMLWASRLSCGQLLVFHAQPAGTVIWRRSELRIKVVPFLLHSPSKVSQVVGSWPSVPDGPLKHVPGVFDNTKNGRSGWPVFRDDGVRIAACHDCCGVTAGSVDIFLIKFSAGCWCWKVKETWRRISSLLVAASILPTGTRAILWHRWSLPRPSWTDEPAAVLASVLVENLSVGTAYLFTAVGTTEAEPQVFSSGRISCRRRLF